jgi:hypothetical protein
MARSRAISPARLTGSLLGVSAVMRTESTPYPRERLRTEIAKYRRQNRHRIGAHAAGLDRRARRSMIHAQNAAAGGLQQLHRELAEQTKADDRDQDLQASLLHSNAVQCHRTQVAKAASSNETLSVRRNSSVRAGNARHQQSRNTAISA